MSGGRGRWGGRACKGALVAMVFVLAVTPASAQPAPPGKTIGVSSTFTEPPSSVDGLRCRGLSAPPPDCRAVEKVKTTFAGTLTGVADAEIVGSVGLDGKYHFDGTWTLTEATVEDCGSGGLVIEMHDGVVELDPSDPSKPAVGRTQWRVKHGMVTGVGAAEFVFSPADVATDHWVQGAFRGTMTCLPQTPSPPMEILTIQVRAEYTEPIPGAGLHCRGVATANPLCQAAFPGPATFTGTIAGNARAESVGPAADGHHYEGPDIFDDAVVEGCGRGGLVIDTYAGEMHPEDVKPDGSTGGFNLWRIRPGSGTGGLSGLLGGQGENNWRQYWSETGTDTWGRGVFTGTITCAVPKQAAATPPRVLPASQETLPETGALTSAGCGLALLGVSLALRRALQARLGF